MKNIIKFSLVAICSLVLASSCIKETFPQGGSATAVQVAAAPGAFDGFVDALTAQLAGFPTYGGGTDANDFGMPRFFIAWDSMGQDLVQPSLTNGWFNSWYIISALGPTYANSQYAWTLYYSAIKSCNDVINLAGEEPDPDKIVGAGVRVFKIEGRARSAEYVRRTVSCYRRAADAVCDGTYTPELAVALKAELAEVFNRGFWDGYYQGARLGEWSEVYGSHATKMKIYCGKVSNWFDRINVAEITVETRPLRVGDEVMVIGATTGCVQFTAEDIRVDFVSVPEAGKGVRCSLAVPAGTRLRRGDKLYLWVDSGRGGC